MVSFVSVGALVMGGAVGWAASEVLQPAADPLKAESHTYAVVSDGEVGASLAVSAVSTWPSEQVGTNQAVGVVTTVEVQDGVEVDQGSTLFSVDLAPVVIAEGEVPMFRAISRGVEGPDVGQLQAMLQSLSFYSGPIDGKAEAGTERAIKLWQRAEGGEETGIVPEGSIVFVPRLPSRVTLDTNVVSRGLSLSGGESVVSSLPTAPSFVVPATDQQAAEMTPGTRVEITSPAGAVWTGIAGGQTRDDESQSVEVALEATSGSSICADTCAEIPVSGQTVLPARAITTETVTGLVVPAAAVLSSAGNTPIVIDDAGNEIPVRILASARGMVAIDGASLGVRVRVPATKDE